MLNLNNAFVAEWADPHSHAPNPVKRIFRRVEVILTANGGMNLERGVKKNRFDDQVSTYIWPYDTQCVRLKIVFASTVTWHINLVIPSCCGSPSNKHFQNQH